MSIRKEYSSLPCTEPNPKRRPSERRARAPVVPAPRVANPRAFVTRRAVAARRSQRPRAYPPSPRSSPRPRRVFVAPPPPGADSPIAPPPTPALARLCLLRRLLRRRRRSLRVLHGASGVARHLIRRAIHPVHEIQFRMFVVLVGVVGGGFGFRVDAAASVSFGARVAPGSSFRTDARRAPPSVALASPFDAAAPRRGACFAAAAPRDRDAVLSSRALGFSLPSFSFSFSFSFSALRAAPPPGGGGVAAPRRDARPRDEASLENLFAGASSSESCGWGWARGPGDVRGRSGGERTTERARATAQKGAGVGEVVSRARQQPWGGAGSRVGAARAPNPGCHRRIARGTCSSTYPAGRAGGSATREGVRAGGEIRVEATFGARAHLQVDVRAQVEDLGQVRVLLDQAPLPRAVFLHALTKRVLLLVRPLRRGGRGVGVRRTEREARGVVGGGRALIRGCRRAYRGREGRSRARTLVLEAPIVLEGSSGRSDRRAASLARASRARQCRPRHHPRVRRGDASSALRNPCLRQVSQRRYPYDKSARATLDRLS